MGAMDFLRDKWYAFSDWCFEKGIPKPLVFLLIILLIVGAVYFLFPEIFSDLLPRGKAKLTVTVVDKETSEPVENATVRIEVEGEFYSQKSTDSSGLVEFELPIGKEGRVIVSKGDFSSERNVKLEEDLGIEIKLETEPEITTFSKKIEFVGEDGSLLGKRVDFRAYCQNNEADYSKLMLSTDSEGSYTLEGIPSNCGPLNVEVLEIEGVQDFEKGKFSGTVSEETRGLKVEVIEKNLTGEAQVRVKTVTGDTPEKKCEVRLEAVSGGQSTGYQALRDSGSTEFKDVIAGTYRVEFRGYGNYEIVDPDKSREVKADGYTTFYLEVRALEEEPKIISVKIHKKGLESQGVKGIQLELFDGAHSLDQTTTNQNGEASFEVAVDKKYSLTAEKGGKSIFEEPKKVNPRPETWMFPFDPDIFKKANTLIVYVRDQDEKKLDGVKIKVLNENGSPTGMEKVTGADGKLEFESVQPGRYYAEASLPGFKPADSEIFSITKEQKQPTTVEIVLEIGKGNYEFTVMDSTESPLAAAKIKGISLKDGEVIISEKSDEYGEAKLTVRMDKKPFFVVSLPGYMPFVTKPIKPVQGTTQEVRAELLEETNNLQVKFSGLKYEEGVMESTVEAGQVYKADLQIIVPDKGYNTAGIHFRTGKDQQETNTVEEDIISISSVDSAAQKIIKSTSYSPPSGTTSDLQHTGSGQVKWANIEWHLGKNGLPEYGVFTASAEVMVSDLAGEGELAKVNYRGWGEKAGYERDPVDSVLGKSASAAEKQGLYAKTYEKLYSVGVGNWCLEGYCRIISIEDLVSGTKSSVVDKFTASVSTDYKLRFTINKSGAGTIRNARIRISNGEKGLYFTDYRIMDALGAEKSGSVDGFELVSEIGSLSQNKTFSGYVEFETRKSGSNSLIIAIESDSGTELEQQINVEVEEGREMNLEFVPKEIVPMIDNQMLFRFYEEETTEEEETVRTAVKDASVSVFLNENLLGSGHTDSEGVFGLEIEAPEAGSTLKVTATKSGFKRFKKEIEIDEKIITLIPKKLSLDMKPTSRETATLNFSVENSTAIPLKVSNLSLSESLAPYLEIKNLTELKGKEIEAGKTKEIELSVELTKKGKLVEKTVGEEGSVGIEFQNQELNKKWPSELGIDFRILLGGELDLLDCLHIEPTQWKIDTYGKERTLTLNIRNECTVVGGESTAIRNLEVKTAWLNENSVGKFRVLSDSFEEKVDLTLDESYKTIVERLPAEFDGTILVSFKPGEGTKSAESSPEIMFRAKHYSNQGSETVKNKVLVSLTINKLSECLRVITEEEKPTLRTLPYNYGWGMVESYYDRDPYAEEQQQQPQQQWWQQQWPTNQYQIPWQTQQGVSQTQPEHNKWEQLMEEEKTSLTLENACTETVQISMRLDSGLELEEEKEFEIEPYQSHELTIKPTSKIGSFEVKTRAKLTSQKGFYKDVDSLKIRVMRFEEITEKCKPTVEPVYFRANFLGWQRSAGRIINRCYDLGYRLQKLDSSVFHCYRPDSMGTEMKGPCPLIEQVWSGTPKVQETENGEKIEVLEFGLKYNPHIIEQLPVPLEGTPEQRIGKLRIVFSRLMNSIISPGVISVPIKNPWGEEKWIPREVTFEDPFEWIGVPGMLISEGDPNKMPGECIPRKGYFVLENWGEEWAILGDDHFTENRFVWKESVPKREMLLPYAISNDEVVEKKFCGSSDKITKVKPTVLEDSESGVKLSFKITSGGHHVVMTVDRSGMFTRCASIDKKITATVKRAFHNTEAADVILPVKFRVLNKGVGSWTQGCDQQAVKERPVPDWSSVEPCVPGEETGAAVYTGLGFDRLLLKWRAGELASDACDPVLTGSNQFNEDYHFCDATQFTLAISKKFNEIRQLVEKVSTELKESTEFKAVASAIAEHPELVEEINNSPGKLFKLFKKQLIVTDSVEGKRHLLFMQEDPTGSAFVLEPEPHPQGDCTQLQETAASLKEITDTLTAKNEMMARSALVDNLNSFEVGLSKCYGKDIGPEGVIGLIHKGFDDSVHSSQNPQTEQIWLALRGENGLMEMYGDYYILSYNEYKALHNEILIEWQNTAQHSEEPKHPDNPYTVEVGGLSINAPQGAWYEFLSKLYQSIEFKTGITNSTGLSERSEKFVRERAVDSLEEDFTKLSSTKLSSARLIKDNYSQRFVEDFTAYYSGMGFSPQQIHFTQYAARDDEKGFYDEMTTELPSTGEYWYRIEPFVTVNLSDPSNYSIQLNKMVVKIALKKGLKQIGEEEGTAYQFNPFLYLPFDGEIGQGKANVDYGVGFRQETKKPIYYFFESEGKWTAVPKRMPGITALTPTYSDTYQETRKGTILSLNLRKGTLDYSPSYPVAISADWREQRNNILYYRFQPEALYGQRASMKELLVWWQLGKGQSDSFKEFEPDSICSGWNDSMYLGKVMLGKNSPWHSLAFIPADAAQLNLELICAKEPTIITAKTYEGSSESTSETTGIEGGLVSLVERGEKFTALKDYIEKIKYQEVCINRKTMTEDFIELRWNPLVVGLTEEFAGNWGSSGNTNPNNQGETGNEENAEGNE